PGLWCIKVLSCLCQEDTEGEIKREQTQEQRTEKDSMYELSAKNDRLNYDKREQLAGDSLLLFLIGRKDDTN
ncbi:MAG: hypothetical protein MSS16_09450, partial [Streptococcus orisratti]|uniref:hypothetical protein n=1 Tax=Streptococcus orisratti TaxID=114652 RepID=UPI0023570EA1